MTSAMLKAYLYTTTIDNSIVKLKVVLQCGTSVSVDAG